MQAIRVQYTVREDFAETNAANIRAVMDELRESGAEGIQYTAFRIGDGNTFVHIVVMASEAQADIVPGLAAFGRFRAALRDGAVTPPTNEAWTVVGTSYAL